MTINSFSGEYRFLSNFWPCSNVLYRGYEFPSVEHAYQAAKLDISNLSDAEIDEFYNRVSKMTAGQTKRLGKSLKIRKDWELVKLEVMSSLVFQKFIVEPLKTKLLSTYPHELIEGNTWGDTFWGVCDGVGQNHLGEILMKIRQELMENG